MKHDAIGAPLRRKEDKRLLLGRGSYSGDVPASRETAGVFLRSDTAHGTIRLIDVAEAQAMPGVVAVFTAANLCGGHPPLIGPEFQMYDADGAPIPEGPRPAICHDKVRMVGDILALVVAETETLARDALDAIELDIEPLPAAGTIEAAQRDGMVNIWDSCPGNVAFRAQTGDARTVERALADAAHVVELKLVNQRITANPMEPRCALAIPETDGKIRLVIGNQAPHLLRRTMAPLMGMAEQDLVVVSKDMGGGFGMRASAYGEEIVLCLASRKTGRPIRWTALRHEAVATDAGARGHITRAQMALDADGGLLGLRVRTQADLGAYLTAFGPAVPMGLFIPLIPNVYRLPAIDVEVLNIMTNTTPTQPYRGAGRPEAVYLMERLMETAARQIRIDPLELRRRNMIRQDEMPHTTVTGLAYDSGYFPGISDEASGAARDEAFEQRCAASRGHGRLRGLGLAAFTETAAGAGPGVFETAHVHVHPGGSVSVAVGTHSHGQGHATVFAQIAGDRMGLSVDCIDVIYGDTSQVPFGQGTYGSRSISMAGPAIVQAADKVIDKGRSLAAHLMEASADDVEFADGAFAIAGTDRSMTWAQLAAKAYVAPNFAGSGLEPGLEDQAFFTPEAGNFPNGCHVAEVEIDPETGHWTLERYTAANDFGRVINPLLLDGQTHGGVTQGIGQAMMEGIIYDDESGQLLSATFMDYAMPRAGDLPSFTTIDRPDLCVTNPLGVKGAGELGTTGAPPVIINALIDALAPLGVTSLDMPATPQTVWRAIQNAGAA